MVIFTVGELFDSLASLQDKIQAYSELNFCHFYVKDSKKLQHDETVNPHLIYKHIAYSCIYGGQKARFRGTGTRSVASIRHGCCAGIYLRVTRDREHLQVRSFVDVHNHEVNEDLYRSASQDRRLPYELKTEVEELLLLGADKDRLIDYIRNASGKNVDKKHLFNVYETAVKHQREITRDRALMLIQKAYGLDDDQEAETVLTNLLDNARPRPRRGRKPEIVQVQEDSEEVQIAYFNEAGEETNDDSEMGDELQRIMGTLQGTENERIVIVEGDEQYEVIEADPSMEAEYLEEDDVQVQEVKQEIIPGDDESVISNVSGRFRQYLKRPTPVTKARPVTKYTTQDHFEPPRKVRAMSMQMQNNSADDGELTELRRENLELEKEKLTAEVEMLKLQKNKLARDISKVDLEKSKFYLEIDLYKLQKKYYLDKQQATELQKEKLRLEISKLKAEPK